MGILYTYRVKAFTGSHESGYSNEASHETFFPAPVNLKISASTEYSVTFVWQDQCNFEQGYVVKYIRQDGMDTTTVLIPANSTSYTLDDISKEYIYYFKVYAYTPFNESASLTAYSGYRKEFVPEAQLTGLSKMIRGLDFSANSALLAAGDENGQVKVWDTGTWSQRQSLSADTAAVPDMVTALNFAGTNPWLAMGGLGGTVRVVNSTFWSEVAYLFLNAYTLYDVKFSPNDQCLAAAQYKFIYVWSTDGWSLSKNLTGHNDAIYSIAFSKNGAWLASAGRDQDIRIWSTQTWTTIQTLTGHNHTVRTWCAFLRTRNGWLRPVKTRPLKSGQHRTGLTSMTSRGINTRCLPLIFQGTGNGWPAAMMDRTGCVSGLLKAGNKSTRLMPQDRERLPRCA